MPFSPTSVQHLLNFTVPRLLPSRWLVRLIARNVGLA